MFLFIEFLKGIDGVPIYRLDRWRLISNERSSLGLILSSSRVVARGIVIGQGKYD